jgi:hypothetical protein
MAMGRDVDRRVQATIGKLHAAGRADHHQRFGDGSAKIRAGDSARAWTQPVR